MKKSTTKPRPAAKPKPVNRPSPKPFRVRNAACAKCGGPLYCAPGRFPGCPRCGRVKLSGGRPALATAA